jgi:NAD(P)-dependent dehydrogenase (short-subunit alcohol dehydrogenase family)
MKQREDDNFVLVTGASRGIGRGAALELAAAGFDLILWARSGADLEEVAAECRAAGRRVEVARVDVSDPESIASAGGASLANLGGLRGLVLNAGIGIWNTLDEVSPDEWRQIIGTNLDGAFYTLKFAVPYLTRHPRAQIVAVISDSAAYAYAGRSAYCASKWGMRGLVEAVRREVRPHGVRVTQLLPSRVDTYFRGKTPGARADSLSTGEVGRLIATVFTLPSRLELREIPVAAITSSYGPFGEVFDGTEAEFSL